MTKSRNFLTATFFALVAANAHVFLAQSASADAGDGNSSTCSNAVKTTDFNKITPEEYVRTYRSG